MNYKKKSPMQQHKHIKKRRQKEKRKTVPTFLINIDQFLNEALTLIVHTIT